jgi:hypothetical protein
MSKTRNNHYVPQWYQEGFFEPGENTLAYLDLTPKQETLADGAEIVRKVMPEKLRTMRGEWRDVAVANPFGPKVLPMSPE